MRIGRGHVGGTAEDGDRHDHAERDGLAGTGDLDIGVLDIGVLDAGRDVELHRGATRRRRAVDGGATGHSGLVLRFRNTSGQTCALFGYPGVAALDASGAQFEQARRTTSGFLGGATARSVTLAPGAVASALLEGDANANGGGGCDSGVAVLVTPPNTVRSTRVPFRGYFCELQVHPVVAGIRGKT